MTDVLAAPHPDYHGQREAQSHRMKIFCALVRAFGLPDDYVTQAQFNYEWPERSNTYEFTTSWGQAGLLLYLGPDKGARVQLLPLLSTEAQSEVNSVLEDIQRDK